MALESFIAESGRRPLVSGFVRRVHWIRLSLIDSRRRNELILLNNRGIGGSTDDGQPFDIAKLAADAAHVIETLGYRARKCDGMVDGRIHRAGTRVELRGSR